MHSVLDIVEVTWEEPFIAMGLAGQRGAVLSIRRYPGGCYRYTLGNVPGSAGVGEDGVGGIYDEEHLVPTGMRADAWRYGPIPPFRPRDVVQISLDCDVEEARGLSGYVAVPCSAESGPAPIGIWVHGLEEACIIDARYLTRTGERLPTPPGGKGAHRPRSQSTPQSLGRQPTSSWTT
jgi:hypothetical protein